MKLRVTVFLALMLGLTLPAFAQVEDVTVREINKIPDENVAELTQKGAALTDTEVNELVRSALEGETVRFTAVVIAEPSKSGLASLVEGRPGRVHFFVRDTSAVTQGKAGMDIQIVDAAYDENGTGALVLGDVATFTARVDYFGNTIQMTPQGAVDYLGPYQSLDLPDDILDPVTITTSDAVQNVGELQVQANWENLSSLNNQFVRVEGATVWRSPNRTDDRPNFAVTSDGAQTILHNDDMSLRYRNDQSAYPDDFDVLEERFVAPPAGATVDIQGFLALRGTFDAFEIGVPSAGLVKIIPWTDEDLVVTAEPLITNFRILPLDGIPGDEDVTVEVAFTGNASDVESVVLTYESSAGGGEQEVDMTQHTDTSFVGTIPAQADEAFVTYSVVLSDVSGTEYVSPTTPSYRVLFEGLSSVRYLQETASGGRGASPFAGQTLDMDITATVQTDVSAAGFLSVQDNSAPWSGIFIEVNEAIETMNLQPGDQVRITSGSIAEIRGDLNFTSTTQNVTAIRSAVIEKTGEGDPIDPVVVTTAQLQDAAIAAAHEGMLIRFEDVTILNNRLNNFGEWTFSSDGTEDNAFLADDVSDDIGSTFSETTFENGDEVTYIAGILSYAFGDDRVLPRTLADIGEITGTSSETELIAKFALEQNYPNPFNPSTKIEYSVPAAGQVSLEVFDMLGRRVMTLVDGQVPAGSHSVVFQAGELASGLYLYRLRAGNKVTTRTMMLIK